MFNLAGFFKQKRGIYYGMGGFSYVICCCIGTVRNLVDRVYSRSISRLTGIVLLDLYQLLLFEFLFHILKQQFHVKIP